jgi:segregation and condensation protein B
MQTALLKELPAAFDALKGRWNEAAQRGFVLLEVAEGLVFRSSPRYADVMRAMREDAKPQRLSKPAMETLAIIAYRQPVTKPEVDDIRGVDCGGTIKVLLERNLLRIVGKKEEPGRPMLYGTTKEFLSFFNLGGLGQLPSLREFHELSEEAEDELRQVEGLPSLKELSESAKQLRLQDEPEVAVLEEAVDILKSTENAAREALAAQGIALVESDEPPPVSTESATEEPASLSNAASPAPGVPS